MENDLRYMLVMCITYFVTFLSKLILSKNICVISINVKSSPVSITFLIELLNLTVPQQASKLEPELGTAQPQLVLLFYLLNIIRICSSLIMLNWFFLLRPPIRLRNSGRVQSRPYFSTVPFRQDSFLQGLRKRKSLILSHLFQYQRFIVAKPNHTLWWNLVSKCCL